jgi:hypothetical protein
MQFLRFQGRCTHGLSELGEREWRDLLAFCDTAQLTLLLGSVAGDALPGWVRDRIRGNAADYAPRFCRLKRSLLEIGTAFERRGIDYAVLKGIAHAPDFIADPMLRAASDIDLWCRPEQVMEARDVLSDLGFRVAGESAGRHLAPMVRERDWKWTGNYFAPDLPIAVELHFELWDESAEFISAPGTDDFWNRRVTMALDGQALPVLARPDALGFACLHSLMHILHGDLRLQRMWEIGNFLQERANDAEFWSLWQSLHEPQLRRLEAVIFYLANSWFGAPLPPAVAKETVRLPAEVRLWLECYAFRPVEGLFQSRKDEVWLHFALLESPGHKRAVFLRRTFPLRPVPKLIFLLARGMHHLQALVPTLAGAIRWRWRLRRAKLATSQGKHLRPVL